MHKNKMSQLYIGFALHGYENNIMAWLESTVKVFEEKQYPLKSVSYDINYHRDETKSLVSFRKLLNDDLNYPVDKLYSFTAFAGKNQKYPLTWHYGCLFHEPDKILILFFDSSYGEENILSFYKDFLQVLLEDKTVWTGYSFSQEMYYDYPMGGNSAPVKPLYKENLENWDEASNWRGIKESLLRHKNKYRHIYRQNILSKYHLEENFDGVPLADWVIKNNYGNIDKIGIGNWLWTVPEKKLREIQVAFYKKGLLLGVK